MKPNYIVIASVAILTLGITWFFMTHERVTETQNTGYRSEARINRFFAAELLLTEVGIEADSQSYLKPTEWLPDVNDTIVTRLAPTIAVGDEQLELEDWVLSGGHLVVMPPADRTALLDVFLSRLGYQLIEIELDEDSDEAEQDEPDGDDAEETFDYNLNLRYEGFRLELLDEHEPSATLSDEKGIIAARHAWGNGYITVISSWQLFANWQLEDSDHARLLLDIVAGYIDSGKVWFIYDTRFRPLWKLIWDNAPFAVLGLAALLIFSLWTVMPMFGPKVHSEILARRSIIEHIRAAGTFVWKQHGSGELARASAAAVIHEVEPRHPGISRMAAAKQAQLIARLTGLRESSVLEAISSVEELPMREFTQHMETLQKIRKEL